MWARDLFNSSNGQDDRVIVDWCRFNSGIETPDRGRAAPPFITPYEHPDRARTLMKLGYTILYVHDVIRAVEFYERAFDLKRRFVSDDTMYAELDTGATTLSFAAYGLARTNIPGGVHPHDPKEPPAAVEIAFLTDDVEGAYRRAVEVGATGVAEPKTKPWGQTVAWVRDPDGALVELCTPMG